MYRGVKVGDCWRGSYAFLSEKLRREGFRYVSGHPAQRVGDTILYRKNSKAASLQIVSRGMPARRVREPISRYMTRTRTAQTPDIYELCYRETRR